MTYIKLNKAFIERRHLHRIQVCEIEARPLGITTLTVLADCNQRTLVYSKGIYTFDRRLKVRNEIHIFAETMDAMMTVKQPEHGEEWRQLGADELLILAKEQIAKAELCWLDNETEDVKKHTTHAANYLMLAFTKEDSHA